MKKLGMLLPLLVFAALAPAKTVLILPTLGDSAKIQDLEAVRKLFRESLLQVYAGTAVPIPETSGACDAPECAVVLAKEANADEVVYSTLDRLGTRWIFSATLVDGKGRPFNQRGTALDIEDLEAVTRRVAEALVAGKSVEKVATLDNITAREEANEPVRRRSLYKGGFSLGYLYPVDGSFDYTQGGQVRNYSQIVRLAWLNAWEFRENMALGFDLAWGMPFVFGGDINLQYFLNRTDFSPFLGGGLGLHYVGGEGNAPDDKRHSGPALNAQTGLMFFRTYDIHLMARAQYQMILNSDMDHGPIFDVGVVYQKRHKSQASGFNFSWSNMLWGLLIVSVISGIASN